MTRNRRPPPRGHGLVSSADDSFEATLVLDGTYTPTPPSASPHSLVSLIPTTQAIDAMSTTRAQSATQLQRKDDSESEHRGDSDEEADDEQEKRERKLAQQKKFAIEQEDLTLDDDDSAHRSRPPPAATAAAAATAGSKRKEPSTKRIGKWSDEQDLSLCSAVLAYVKQHDGQLPGAARTAKKETAPASWKEIAAATPHCSSLADKNAAARAASSRWTSLRAGVAVRHNKHTQADEQSTCCVASR
jgi:hypothetical protein